MCERVLKSKIIYVLYLHAARKDINYDKQINLKKKTNEKEEKKYINIRKSLKTEKINALIIFYKIITNLGTVHSKQKSKSLV